MVERSLEAAQAGDSQGVAAGEEALDGLEVGRLTGADPHAASARSSIASASVPGGRVPYTRPP